MTRAETARRLADEQAKTRQNLQKHPVVAQALRVGTLRVDGTSKATLRLEIYDSFERLEQGQPDNGSHADIFSVNLSGKRFEAIDRYSDFVSTGGSIEITNYGYPGDFSSDRNSNYFATGLGGSRPLIPGISAALSRSLASKLGVRPGAVIEFLDANGRSYLVTYDDQSPRGNQNIDVYRPTFGSNNFCARVRAARVLRQGSSGISHGEEGLPYSLRNYRAALLELAGENRLPELEDSPSPSSPSVRAEGLGNARTNDFEAVETSLPLALRLDQFANTPFSDTGFSTSQGVTHYIQAGAQSLQQAVALVRKHGLKPGEFPPILRIQANLKAAQEAGQAILAQESKLRQDYQNCDAEIFRVKVQASLEDNPIALAEVRQQIEDLECTQTAILAQLEEQANGPLRPASPDPSTGNRPTQITSTRDLWKLVPDG